MQYHKNGLKLLCPRYAGLYLVVCAVIVFLTAATTLAEPLPEIVITNPDAEYQPLAADIPTSCPGWPHGSYAERPPWVVRLPDGILRCFIGTNHAQAYNIRPGRSLLSDADAIDAKTCHLASRGLVPRGDVEWPDPEDVVASPEYWRSHYYGVSTTHLIENPETGEPGLVAIMHGENKDQSWSQEWAQRHSRPGWYYPCTILPPPEDGKPRGVEETYFAFVGMAWSPLDEHGGANFMEHDFGPIVWPIKPYLDENENRLTVGPRHPYGFVHKEYLYVYYKDQTDGRIRVMRAPLNKLFEPGAFRVYSDGSFSEPALPAGFEKGDRRFLKEAGGKGEPIMPAHRSMRFQVSRLKGTPYFIGVDSRYDIKPGTLLTQGIEYYGTYLHLSRDLVNWGEGTLVPGSKGEYYDSLLGQRPVLSNKDYTGHDEIDPNGFYIAGKRQRGREGIFLRFTSIELAFDSDN